MRGSLVWAEAASSKESYLFRSTVPLWSNCAPVCAPSVCCSEVIMSGAELPTSEGAPSDAFVCVLLPVGASSAPVANTGAGASENSIITASNSASMLFFVFFMWIPPSSERIKLF